MKMVPVTNLNKFLDRLESMLYSLQAGNTVLNEFDAMTKRYLGNHTRRLSQQNDMIKEIAIYWHIDDVKSIRPDLSDDQASSVLIHLKRTHDANEGINWQVIECAIDILYPSIA